MALDAHHRRQVEQPARTESGVEQYATDFVPGTVAVALEHVVDADEQVLDIAEEIRNAVANQRGRGLDVGLGNRLDDLPSTTSWTSNIARFHGSNGSPFPDTRPIGPDGRRLGSIKLIQKPLVTRMELIYSDVTLNPSLKDTDFVFEAQTGIWSKTAPRPFWITSRRPSRARWPQKKAEAAAAGGRAEPLLNQAIDVPKAKSEPSGAEPH